MSLAPDMVRLIDDLLVFLREDLTASHAIFLARGVAEMNTIAKHVDRKLGKAPYFARVAHNGGAHRYLFNLTLPGPGELWVADIEDATPAVMVGFLGEDDSFDCVVWPDSNGCYIVVNYDRWMEHWENENTPYRAPFREEPDDQRYLVGPPIGWTPPEPPPPKVSVWQHILGNSSIRRRKRKGGDTHGNEEARREDGEEDEDDQEGRRPHDEGDAEVV